MKLYLSLTAVMPFLVLGEVHDDGYYYRQCLAQDKGQDVAWAINHFCFSPPGALEIPSPHAHDGSKYKGVHVYIKQGQCIAEQKKASIPRQVCMDRLHAICGSAMWSQEYGCQKWIIHKPGFIEDY